jgi:hypothetical protein
MRSPLHKKRKSKISQRKGGVPRIKTKNLLTLKFTAMLVEITYRDWDTDEIRKTKLVAFGMEDARMEADLLCGDVMGIEVLDDPMADYWNETH